MSQVTISGAAPPPDYPQLLGHPRPLWMLFMAEFWERFAFYGMRWALTLYIVAQFFGGDEAGQASASRTYGAYLALVYATAVFGGYVADKIIGYQRSILLGAVVMASGLFMVMVPQHEIFMLAWPRSSSATACSSRTFPRWWGGCTRRATRAGTAVSRCSTWASMPVR